MPYCTYCGSELSETATYCPNCGKQVELTPEEKAPLFKNVIQMNKEALKKFFKSQLVLSVLMLVLSPILIVMGVTEILDFDTLGIIELVGGIVALCFSVFLLIGYRNTVYKNKRFNENSRQEFSFDETGVSIIHYDGEEVRSTARIDYTQMTKVKKLNGMPCIVVTNLAYILDEHGFTIGNYEDFKAFMIEKLGKKNVKL